MKKNEKKSPLSNTKEKRDKEQIPKGRRKLEIILV